MWINSKDIHGRSEVLFNHFSFSRYKQLKLQMNQGSSIVSVQTSQTKKSVLCDIYLTNDIFLSIICNRWKRTTRCKQRSPLHTAQHWLSVDKVTNPSYPGDQKQSVERARVKGLIWARGKNGNGYLGVLVTIFCCALCFLCWIWECHDNGRLPTIPQPRSFQCTRPITHSHKVLSRQWWNKKYRANCTIIEPPYNSHILPSQQGETDVYLQPTFKWRKNWGWFTLWFSAIASSTSFVNEPPWVDVPIKTVGFNFCSTCQHIEQPEDPANIYKYISLRAWWTKQKDTNLDCRNQVFDMLMVMSKWFFVVIQRAMAWLCH